MKLSLAWIFDHIAGSWDRYNIHDLVNRFNRTTAEIDHVVQWKLDLAHIYMAMIVDAAKEVRVFCPETNKEYLLAQRQGLVQGGYYLITIKNKIPSWTTLAELGSLKEGLIAQVALQQGLEKGRWKKQIEKEDYILTIDNKSITNRPDLWSHRGVAREIAALYDLTLVPIDEFLASTPIVEAGKDTFKASEEMQCSLENTIPNLCKRFAGVYAHVQSKPSDIQTALRLLRVDARPIDAIVDTTNYVMFDLGQPLHAFDAHKIKEKKLIVKHGKADHTLQLLDGTDIELNVHDIIISDGKQPLALAGVMGGMQTAVDRETTSICIEAACFDATSIRKSAFRHKKRTEASVRFEKGVDPMQNTIALQRGIYILQKNNVLIDKPSDIISLGKQVLSPVVSIKHAYIEKTIGATIEPSFIEKTLEKLGFKVTLDMKTAGGIEYSIVVPTFRATRDIELHEDIVEEVARFYGFDRIEKKLPSITRPGSKKIDAIHDRVFKEVAAFGLRAHEVHNYAVYDESFLQRISWEPKHAVAIINPISSMWRQLVTSLIPHLIKNVVENAAEYEGLRFFECNRIWYKLKDQVVEEKKFAGIFFTKKEDVDFYQSKDTLQIIFDMLHVNVSWRKPEDVNLPVWCHPYQTSQLYIDDQYIGYAGKINRQWLETSILGDAFIFELDMYLLNALSVTDFSFKPSSKFPATSFDVSMLIPLPITVDKIKSALLAAESSIQIVQLIDLFEKDEWGDKKSITVRCHIQDPHKTLTKEDIDTVYNKAVKILQKLGASIR